MFAQESSEGLIAESPAGSKRIFEMNLPVIRLLLSKRDSNRHLCHHCGTAATNKAFVEKENGGALPRRCDRGVHPGAACSDDQNICGQVQHNVGELVTPISIFLRLAALLQFA